MAARGEEVEEAASWWQEQKRSSAPSPLLQNPRGPTTPRSHFPATWGRKEGTTAQGVRYPSRLENLGGRH